MFTFNHEQSLIEQGFLCNKASAIQDEVGDSLVGYLGRPAQNGILLWCNTKAYAMTRWGSGDGGHDDPSVKIC
ncbi:hypothetical protein GCM10027295_12580 [Pseudaeromonas pectinilytica]